VLADSSKAGSLGFNALLSIVEKSPSLRSTLRFRIEAYIEAMKRRKAQVLAT